MKRVLIVYHSFDEWEMGPIRLRRIARNLSAAGFEPVVLTSEKTARTAADIPNSVTCLRAGGVDLAEVYRKLKTVFSRNRKQNTATPTSKPGNTNNRLTSMINRWMMIPDKQITWKKEALKIGRAYLNKNKVDVIFASLAPRTNLLVAAKLSKEFDLPCVMEFRDLWTGSPYYHLTQPTALHRLLHRRLEKKVIASATTVSAVCRGIAGYLNEKYRHQLDHPVSLNYNFYDETEYPHTKKPDAPRPMIVSYIGAMYASRSPLSFFKGLKKFIEDSALKPTDIRFRWAGSVIGVSGVDEAIRDLELEPFIDRLGQLSHVEALKELCMSDVSVLIQAPGDAIHIPGKLFEAIGANVPLLTIADDGEVRDIIENANAGVVCPHTPEGISGALSKFRDHHKSSEAWQFNEAVRNTYSADYVVGKLADLFNEAVQLHDQ